MHRFLYFHLRQIFEYTRNPASRTNRDNATYLSSRSAADLALFSCHRLFTRCADVPLRLKRALNPDAVALKLLEQFIDKMKEDNIHVLVCGVSSALYSVPEPTDMIERFGKHVFREQLARQTSTMRAIQHAYH